MVDESSANAAFSKPFKQDDQASSDDDFVTPDVFYTATPGNKTITPGRLDLNTEYGQALQNERLVVAKEVENNWSGRGQHVQFAPGEAIPLEVERAIGHSSTALIESVRCRRIRLARKSIRCTRNAKLEDLIQEVAYLHRLRHPHVIQLVGTYLQNKTFAILLYPVATRDMSKFLDEWEAQYGSKYMLSSLYTKAQQDLTRMFLCLAHAVDYMHKEGIKHMDIKPSNILVHERREIGGRSGRKVYIQYYHFDHDSKEQPIEPILE
ncbi:hypothetical protein N0V90_004751 [Kalmusia sp. IMI 367209]|nr:hypothetical protein N0V90_004751 [Kalmusia sp. IMI 367209]